jgi:hypothetical protein
MFRSARVLAAARDHGGESWRFNALLSRYLEALTAAMLLVNGLKEIGPKPAEKAMVLVADGGVTHTRPPSSHMT